MSNFEIGAFFPSPYRWWKREAISKLESFLTEWSPSYIVLALVSNDRERMRDFWKNTTDYCPTRNHTTLHYHVLFFTSINDSIEYISPREFWVSQISQNPNLLRSITVLPDVQTFLANRSRKLPCILLLNCYRKLQWNIQE